jgi:DNA-binding winged helix-turn-helix (wHTH) protein
MANQQAPKVPISFGSFEVDLRTEEVRKQGMRIRLPGQSFQVLTMLLREPGELVTREELQQALWPADTFVDFEHGVNAAVKRLRQALGDSAEHPTFIETLPRRGYRFIAPVTRPADATGSAVSLTPVEGVPVEAPSVASVHTRKHVLPVVAVAGCLALVIASVAILFFITREKVPAPRAQPRLVPLTTYTGREYQPALAPDGNRVAFAD